MNKSQIFKKAHELAKSVHVAGDCYRVTFGAALKIVIAESKAPVITKDVIMAAFKSHSLDACMKNWAACGIKNFGADIADFNRSWDKTHSDARHARNVFVSDLLAKNPIYMGKLNNEDMNALVDVFGLDKGLYNKHTSRNNAVIAAIKSYKEAN